eukprot:scaffold12769_cov141-Cylindrotheca_fusiformis.AAC.16
MGGWLKSKDPNALDRIEGILSTMEQCYMEGNDAARPDRVTINTITAATARGDGNGSFEKSVVLRTSLEKKYKIKPDSISHNIVLDSWCKSGQLDAPEQAEELLDRMERQYKRGKVTHKPDGYTYSSVIGCYIKFGRKNSAEKAEELLLRMQDLYHNWGGEPVSTSVYNAVMNAWASLGPTVESLQRVRELLQEMEENDGEDPAIPAPNRISYNTVIKAMRDGSAVDAAYAEDILSVLESRGQTENHLLPDSYSYTSVITAYGRSDASDKAEKALELLERMLVACENGNIAAKPTVHSFNAALNSCAFAEGDEQDKANAFDIAMKIYALLQEHDEPDQTSYGTLIRACSVLLHPRDKKREEIVEELFQKACETGSVGKLVIGQMKFAASREQHIRLTGRDLYDKIQLTELPRAWTQNVRETDRRS